MNFDDAQSAHVDSLTRQIEQRSGTRLMTAVVDRADIYPEIVWKSFAMGICAHALVHLIQIILQPDRGITWSLHHTLGFILGTSAAIALLTQYWKPFGRLFVDRAHAEKSVRRYAAGVFLEREMVCTPSRTGVLLLVSLFERQVVILSDVGIAGDLDGRARQQVIDRMAPHLRREEHYQAIVQGLHQLDAVLSEKAASALSRESTERVRSSEAFVQLKGVQ